MKGQAGDRVRQELDTRSTEAGEQLGLTAEAMRRTGEQLRSDGKETPAKVVTAVADRAERLGSYLTLANADQMLRDVENFARRQPFLFAVGGATLGFLAARFMKASSSSRYEGSNGSGSYRPARSPLPPGAGRKACRAARPGSWRVCHGAEHERRPDTDGDQRRAWWGQWQARAIAPRTRRRFASSPCRSWSSSWPRRRAPWCARSWSWRAPRRNARARPWSRSLGRSCSSPRPRWPRRAARRCPESGWSALRAPSGSWRPGRSPPA